MSCSKQINEDDVARIYRQCYKEKIEWQNVLHPDVFNYLLNLQKGHNAPMDFSMMTLLSLTSCIAGSGTRMIGNDAFESVLNQFMILIADTGAGKSPVYDHIIRPAVEAVSECSGINIQVNAYTSPGLQRRNEDNEGYVFVTGK